MLVNVLLTWLFGPCNAVFSIQLMRLSSCYYLQSTWWKKCIEAKTFVIGVAQVRFTVDYCAAGGFGSNTCMVTLWRLCGVCLTFKTVITLLLVGQAGRQVAL